MYKVINNVNNEVIKSELTSQQAIKLYHKLGGSHNGFAVIKDELSYISEVKAILDAKTEQLNKELFHTQENLKKSDKLGLNTSFFESEIERLNASIQLTYELGNKILDTLSR